MPFRILGNNEVYTQGKNILGAIFFIWSVNGLANTILYGPLSNEFQAAILE
jgi:hypothetical protein